MLDKERISRITQDKDHVIESFDAGDWSLLAAYLGDTGKSVIEEHSRLLRSLHFGDDDYPACVAEVISRLVNNDQNVLDLIESMLDQKAVSRSNATGDTESFYYAKKEVEVDTSLVSAMMPFLPAFDDVRKAMRDAASTVGFTLKAADDIWESSILIEDIFDLIAKSCIVIVDFTGKNPNVMYETGVAHAMRKEVIPITQDINDVPFDLKHHRVLVYDNNEQGRKDLQHALEDRMRTVSKKHGWFQFVF